MKSSPQLLALTVFAFLCLCLSLECGSMLFSPSLGFLMTEIVRSTWLCSLSRKNFVSILVFLFNFRIRHWLPHSSCLLVSFSMVIFNCSAHQIISLTVLFRNFISRKKKIVSEPKERISMENLMDSNPLYDVRVCVCVCLLWNYLWYRGFGIIIYMWLLQWIHL